MKFSLSPSSPFFAGLLTAVLWASACGGGGTEVGTPDPQAGQAEEALSPHELENGIGPIQSVSLQPLDAALADRGAEVFNMKCSACHKMDQRYVGPPMGDILDRRTPAYIMNMMLNPDEMVKRHPEAKALLAQYMTPMPNQNLTQDDARAILEYFRREAESGA